METLKQRVLPQYACMIDTTGLFLRMPDNYKDDHVCRWNTPGAQFKDGVIGYTKDCDELFPPEELKDESHAVDLDAETTQVKQAVGLLLKHDYINENFDYIGVSKGFINFKRRQASVCAIHDRTHDKLDCFATLFRGHVNIHCFGDKVINDGRKKTIYVGYVGKDITPVKITMKTIKKVLSINAKTIQTKLSNTELETFMDKQRARYEKYTREAMENMAAILKKIPRTTRASRGKGEFKDCAWSFHHFKHFGVFLPSTRIIYAWLEGCIFKILNGGNSFWVTSNYDFKQKMVKYETLGRCPFGNAEDSMVITSLNPSFKVNEPESPDNVMVLNVKLHQLLINHRMTNFHTDIDVIPYLKDEDAEDVDPHLFNMFPGFKYKFEEKKYDIDDEGIPIPPALIKHWVDHFKFIPQASIKKTWLQWWAYNIQHPESKAFNMLIYGKKGTGKSILYEAYKRMIGTYFCMQITKLEQVTGRFNKRLEGKLMTNVNEATNFPTIREWNVFKSLTTELELDIEPKGKECYNISFSGKFLTTTNCRFSAIITADDRRNCCNEIKDDHRNEDAWFDPMVKDLASKDDANEVFRELFLYFANFPLDGFKPQRPPMTKYKLDLIGDQAPDIVTFMREVCENDTLISFDTEFDILHITSKSLFTEYKEWCVRCLYRPKGLRTFYATLNEQFGLCHKDRHYDKEGKRYRGYKIERELMILKFRVLYSDEEFKYTIAD
jgi:hypothetical protein